MNKIYQFNVAMLLLVFIIFKSTISYASTDRVIHSDYTFDVYQSTQVNAKDIDKKYHKNLEKIAAVLTAADSIPTEAEMAVAGKALEEMLMEIKRKGDYSYIGLSPVRYASQKSVGMTLDLVDKNDPKRQFKFLPKPTGSYNDPGQLMASWRAYESESTRLLPLKKKQPKLHHCPAFHCIYGFEQPGLEKYAIKFNDDVPRYKSELIKILRDDKDENKRGIAAYLLAHLKNGDEVVSALTPSINDSSSFVRNSVMRVLGQTAETVKTDKIPINEIILAATYPAESDRNKALYVLQSLTLQPRYADYVKKHGCLAVMSQYNLAQPNLHETAFTVMTHISHQKFPVSDYAAWNTWAKKNCHEFQHQKA